MAHTDPHSELLDAPSNARRSWQPIATALGISVAVLALEIVAGLASHSLALLADAGHVFADVAGMGLSLGAIAIASRPRSRGRSFGLYRVEILAATVNAVILVGIGVVVLIEAVRRFADPPIVTSSTVALVAVLAIAANLASLRILGHGHRGSLIVRATYLEAVGDLLGSLAVLAAAAVIFVFGWQQADAVASIGIAILILSRTLLLLRDSVDVLLEAVPRGVDLAEVERHIVEAPGVREVHDLHAWTITDGKNVVSAHVVLDPEGNAGAVLDHLGKCLADDFDIDHSTFQLETPEHVRWEADKAMPQH
jgi:cobalt-zinc-cadmium efflux system protein